MGDYRSKPYGDDKLQMEGYRGYKPSSNPDHFRSRTFSNGSSYAYGPPEQKESSYGNKLSSNPNHFRSQSVAYDFSYAYGPTEQKESSYGYKPPNHSRSQSVSYDSSYAYGPPQPNQIVPVKDLKLKKAKSTSASGSKSWGLSDPEFQRKKRVASYKVYSVEGKVKGSLRKSFRWIKNRYTQVVNGLW